MGTARVLSTSVHRRLIRSGEEELRYRRDELSRRGDNSHRPTNGSRNKDRNNNQKDYDNCYNEKKKTNNNNNKSLKTIRDIAEEPKKVKTSQLNGLAKEILERTKHLGFFDEIRMELLNRIESDRNFQRVQCDFRDEVELFCSKADLGSSRSELRDRLIKETLTEDSKSTETLKDHIGRIMYKCKNELRELYNEKASAYLKSKFVVDDGNSNNLHDTVISDQVQDRLLILDNQASSLSCGSFQTDSGISTESPQLSSSSLSSLSSSSSSSSSSTASPSSSLSRNYLNHSAEESPSLGEQARVDCKLARRKRRRVNKKNNKRKYKSKRSIVSSSDTRTRDHNNISGR